MEKFIKMKKTLMLIGILSILASNANALVTITNSDQVVVVTDWCGWGKTYPEWKQIK